MTAFYAAGFPHSEISGSMRMCRSPELIAACHVLLRLLMPRHSPCALLRLIYWFSRIMQAPFGFPSVEIVTHVFHNLLQTFAFCCLACPLLSVQFSMCSPRRRGSRGLRFRGYRKGRESSQALDRSSSSNRNIRFDLRDAGIEGSFPRFSKSELSEAGLIWKGRRSQRICSFRGAFANRGNGMELASSDAVPSKLNNAENELSSWPDLGFRSALGKPESP